MTKAELTKMQQGVEHAIGALESAVHTMSELPDDATHEDVRQANIDAASFIDEISDSLYAYTEALFDRADEHEDAKA